MIQLATGLAILINYNSYETKKIVLNGSKYVTACYIEVGKEEDLHNLIPQQTNLIASQYNLITSGMQSIKGRPMTELDTNIIIK